jgi:hypothetical protein
MKRPLWLVAVLLLTLPMGATERVALRVTPNVAFAPATVSITTRIEPDRASRAMEVVVDSLDYYRSSFVQLDGEHAPRSNRFEFRDLPGGDYFVSATLIDASGRRSMVREQVRIVAQF